MTKYRYIFGIPFVIMVGVLGALQIPAFRTPLLHSLVDYALQGQNISIIFNNLSGVFPFHTSWGYIAVNDDQGVCFEAKNMEIEWSPWQWLQGGNTVNFISTQSFRWYRLPSMASTQQGQLALKIPSLTIQELVLPQDQTLKDVKASLTLTADSLHFQGIATIAGVLVEGQAVWEQATQAGLVQGTAKLTSARPLRFNAPYHWDGAHLQIKEAVIEGEGLKISGEAMLSKEKQQGHLHFQVDYITPWAQYFHLDIEGDGLTGTIDLTNQQEIIGHIETSHIAWKDMVIIGSQSDFHYALEEKTLTALNLTCQKIQYQDFFLSSVATQVHQTKAGYSVDLQATDALSEGKWHLSALADWQHVRIHEASYRKAQQNLTLVQPIVWYYDEPWPRSAIQIKAGKGLLHIEAVKKTKRAQVTFQKIPLAILSLFTEAWSGQGNLSGTGWLDPFVDSFPYQLVLKATELHFSTEKNALKATVSTTLHGDKNYLQWKLTATDNVASKFQSEGNIEWATQLLTAQSHGIIALELFNKFLGENDRMAGQLKIQLQVKGTVEQPVMNGQWRLDNGRYEDGDIGLILKDIQMQGQINHSLLTLSHLTAKDIANGSLTGRGVISFQNGWVPSFDLRLQLQQVTLAQTDEIKGLASGPIFLKGPGSSAQLSGNLDVLSLIYDFGEAKALPRTLQVMGEPDKKITPKHKGASSQRSPHFAWVPLNLVLNLKKPLVIKGEGLKSEWQGNITLQGDMKKSYLVGHLDLQGGSFEFFGKKLKLTAGAIDFDKNAPNNPHIMLRAMRETMSLIIYFQITGRASNPAFSFSSMPPLPVEEIVARLLFDKSLGEMSSMQGLQVASALASLQTASGLNVFSKLRNVFGLDVLEFKQTAPNSQQIQGQAQGAISLGKQFSETVYVRAEQGLGADTSKVGVEIKVTPQLSVEADVGGAQSTGAGLNWSKRY